MASVVSAKTHRLSPFNAGLLATVLCCVLSWLIPQDHPSVIQSLDNSISDLIFHIRGPQASSGEVVIVDIDNKSLQDFGQWPWPRNLMAELSRKILDAEPAALGFDIMFSERDRSSPSSFLKSVQESLAISDGAPFFDLLSHLKAIPDYDREFGEVLNDARCVQGYRLLFREDFLKNSSPFPNRTTDIRISPESIPADQVQLIASYRAILNLPEIQGNGRSGFLNLFPDKTGFVRRAPLVILSDGKVSPSLALQMFASKPEYFEITLHLQDKGRHKYFPVKNITIGKDTYSTDEFAQSGINFRGPYSTFLYIPATDVLTGKASSFLRDKYVLVGSTAAEMIDLVTTPFSSRMPGVEVQANIIDNLLLHDFLAVKEKKNLLLNLILILAGGVIISASLAFFPPVISAGVSLFTFLGVAILHYYQFVFLNEYAGITFVLFSLVLVFTVVAMGNYFFERNKRRFIKRAFSQYVSPAVISELMKNPEKLNLLVDTRVVSVMFCDIRNFTTLAEQTPPAELSSFLNLYFSLLSEIIIKHNGTVDKYIGDAIMAVWGSPLRDARHAERAVDAALEMAHTLKTHQSELVLCGQPVRIGIGINTGMVSAGNFGCSRRFDYTVLGDNVNLASRIESATKQYPVDILITEATKSSLGAAYFCRFIDSVFVKGRSGPVDLFEPLEKVKALQMKDKEYSSYLEAVEHYREGDFHRSMMMFRNLYMERNDPLYQMYQQRCEKFAHEPPPGRWSGVYSHG